MPALHVFIDTNVFLNFYSFPEDKSSVLEALLNVLGPGKINLHLPKQVEDEFWRNRETKIHAAVVEFRNANLPTAVPNHMRGAETAAHYKDAIDAAESARKKLVAHVLGLAVLGKLEIDTQVTKVFARAVRYPDADPVLAKAVSRMHKGNPPGKVGNIGDRYNWEMLLEQAPKEDLYIITKDGDFTSVLGALDKNPRPMAFLAKEWAEKAPGRNLYVYSSIQALLSHYEKLAAQPQESSPPVEISVPAPVPEVLPQPPVTPAPNAADLMAQQAKQEAISALVSSQSFAQTHQAIATLSSLMNWVNVEDANKLFEAALENVQVKWILTDSDVNGFYLDLLNKHSVHAEDQLVNLMIEELGLLSEDDPFDD